MSLDIQDRRALELAEALARRRNVSPTEAVIQALEGELRREAEREPLDVRIGRIAADLAARAGPDRRAMPEEEVDAMWGHR